MQWCRNHSETGFLPQLVESHHPLISREFFLHILKPDKRVKCGIHLVVLGLYILDKIRLVVTILFPGITNFLPYEIVDKPVEIFLAHFLIFLRWCIPVEALNSSLRRIAIKYMQIFATQSATPLPGLGAEHHAGKRRVIEECFGVN